jgi:hypothetical protein
LIQSGYIQSAKLYEIFAGSSMVSEIRIDRALAKYWLCSFSFNFPIRMTIAILDILLGFYSLVVLNYSMVALYIIALAVYQLSCDLIDALEKSSLLYDSVTLDKSY